LQTTEENRTTLFCLFVINEMHNPCMHLDIGKYLNSLSAIVPFSLNCFVGQ
jgi:hypothetical protein